MFGVNVWRGFCVAILLSSSNAHAQKLLIGAYEDLPPYSYIDEGQPAGIDIEIANEVFKQLGMNVEYRFYPWARIFKGIEDGHLAGITARFCIEDRDELFRNVSIPSYASKIAVFVPSSKPLVVRNIEDMKGKLVGIIRDYYYGDREFDEGTKVTRVSFDSNEELVTVTANERVDLSIAESIPFTYFSAKLGLQDKITETQVLLENNICLAFSKRYAGLDSDVIADKASAVIQRLKEEGFIDKVLQKYESLLP